MTEENWYITVGTEIDYVRINFKKNTIGFILFKRIKKTSALHFMIFVYQQFTGTVRRYYNSLGY